MTNIRPLSEALAQKAATELNESPDQIHTSLAAIKQWLQKMPHINARIDDQFLLVFLRSCKYRLEKVKEKLDMFYTVRTALPKIMGKRDPLDEKTQKIIQFGQQIFLPKTQTPDGPRIIIHRVAAVDAKVYTIEEALQVTMMINDVNIMTDDNLVISGGIIIIDVANMSLDHILQFTPSLVKQLTVLSQEASPLRQKASHYINTPGGFEMGFSMFKKLLTEKARNRIHIHKNLESLYEHVPRELLPLEYGGNAGPINELMAETNKKLIAHREYFLEENKFCVDESKRPGKPKTADTLFGLQGSFRSLNVD